MKKSEIYKMAQIAVLNCNFSSGDRLEILHELMEEEKLALYCEKQDETKEDICNGESV